ncbi:MAG TPA: hypothetical protein VHG71_03515 [Verrucomicrobiae bacterium]|nr:hypothetical protein [Verrucomicrobiae bacterium]
MKDVVRFKPIQMISFLRQALSLLLTACPACVTSAAPLPFISKTSESDYHQIHSTNHIEAYMVSKYGTWPQISTWTTFDIQTIAGLPNYQTNTSLPLDKYGGRKDIDCTATGFFRVSKLANRWWFIDPEGHPAILPGVCNVGQNILGNDKISDDITRRFGGFTNWITKTATEMSSFAIRSISSDGKSVSDTDTGEIFTHIPGRPAYMSTLQIIPNYGRQHGYWNPRYPKDEAKNPKAWIPECLPVFNPDWPDFVNDQVQKKTFITRKDPWLIGWFSDNELPNSPKTLDDTLNAGTNNPAMFFSYQAALKFLHERKGKNATPSDVTDSDRQAFLELVYDRYYSCLAAAFHKYDSNHLYLGSRLHKYALKNQGILKAAGRYCNVVSINFYAELAPSPALVALWKQAAGDKAFMISEFYIKGNDLKFDNKNGDGWVVHTQADRGRWYENFVLRLLEEQCFVSWQWFKWRDDGEIGSNKGIIDYQFQSYLPFAKVMTDVNHQIYQLADYFDDVAHP